MDLLTDTVIGAAIGSTITLFGVWISNHYQSKSKKEDREHALKSGIFLNATETLVASKLLIMRIPSVTQQELEASAASGIATAKLTVVAKNETVQAVTELSASIGQRILQLLPEKLPIDNLNTDIQILSNSLEGSFQKQNQMLNEMTAFNLRGDSDQRLWKVLQNNFDHHSDQIDRIIKQRDAKYAELNNKLKYLFVKCMEASVSLSNLEIKAISSVREELGMPFDEEKYRATINATNAKMEAEFSKFLVKVPGNA